ncbi:MAG: DUF2318 domain-containing protein [Roseburia sp.]
MTSKKKKGQKSVNNNRALMITAIILCVAVVLVLVVQQNRNNAKPDGEMVSDTAETADTVGTADTAVEETDDADVQIIGEGENLVIPISDISSTASFYPVEVDGTRMEVLAVADSEGNIRTAFNTCQVCYGSGRGYYVQDGNALVCQNCGNRFTMDQVEVQSGGCNPWPIFPENKTVTDDTIEISYDFLKESEEIFSNWKTQY